ncbi:WD40 repeat-like protein [Penicillium cf. griseofulvum]|uniref:WD40 repeat-like protein n=1 Tax=Penicillium cf. griseofulvum TaxID=2972120 RepID=A0A9W9M1Z0_9EURO|nr:WD40 repeat-like protein [Penicillium cf. griseofulvum]
MLHIPKTFKGHAGKKKGEECWQLQGHFVGINDLSFSPDSRLVVSASTDKTLRLWETATGRASHVLEVQASDMPIVLFSSHGRLLASCSDTTTRQSNPVTGIELRKLQAHSVAVTGIAFSPDN